MQEQSYPQSHTKIQTHSPAESDAKPESHPNPEGSVAPKTSKAKDLGRGNEDKKNCKHARRSVSKVSKVTRKVLDSLICAFRPEPKPESKLVTALKTGPNRPGRNRSRGRKYVHQGLILICRKPLPAPAPPRAPPPWPCSPTPGIPLPERSRQRFRRRPECSPVRP